MLDINESAYATLRKIYKHRKQTPVAITREQLVQKTGKSATDLNEDISVLLGKGYIGNPDADADNNGNIIVNDNAFFITQAGINCVETHEWENRRWRISITISVVALIFSAIALAK